MDLLIPKDFASLVKSKNILLDTSVFIDYIKHPKEFKELLSLFREKEITLLTLDLVKMEFLKGVKNQGEYEEREKLIDTVIDAYLPLTQNVVSHAYKLIEHYKQTGSSVSVVDFMLAASVTTYTPKLLLLTKNTTDFPSDVFKFYTYFHLVHKRGIHLYAIYKYDEK